MEKEDLRATQIMQTLETEGWKHIEKIFTDKIMDLQSIRNIETDDPQELALEIRARNTAVDILWETMKEATGTAEQYSDNQSILEDEDFVNRY